MSYRVGVDTGGTFTDIILMKEKTGEYCVIKVPTTTEDLSNGFIDGVNKSVGLIKADAKEIAAMFHGTTFATNLILQGQFQKMGLIVTRGFKDILEIGRQITPGVLGDVFVWVKPERIVPPERIEEVTQRMNACGEVLIDLSDAEVREIAKRFKKAGVDNISVSLLYSYINPAHEDRICSILQEEYPGCYISLSSQVLPEYKEYERTITTLINSSIVPYMSRYVKEIETKARKYKIKAPLFVMKSSGGVATAEETAKRPVGTALSGVAAGVLGAIYTGEIAGYKNIISFDVGGTSTDISLIENGKASITNEGMVDIYPLRTPMIDVVSVGAGGGSIAWVGLGQSLKVGPKSAGSNPGPACYDTGGAEPTLTDANLILGRIPDHLLSGTFKLNRQKAEAAVQKVADSIGLSLVETADGIVEVAILNTLNGIRQVTTRKGKDPRDYVLMAFGGAGPLLAGRVAELLGVQAVVVPQCPGVLSAAGLLYSDMEDTLVQTVLQKENELDLGKLNRIFSELENRVINTLQEQGVHKDKISIKRLLDMRYAGAGSEITVDVPARKYTEKDIHKIVDAFHNAHKDLYGYDSRGEQIVEFVNVRVTGTGIIDRPAPRKIKPGDENPQDALKGTRKVFFQSFNSHIDCRIYEREKLLAGNIIDGPAIVDQYDSTTVVFPGKKALVDSYGNMIIK